jgi:hypothetical protein
VFLQGLLSPPPPSLRFATRALWLTWPQVMEQHGKAIARGGGARQPSTTAGNGHRSAPAAAAVSASAARAQVPPPPAASAHGLLLHESAWSRGAGDNGPFLVESGHPAPQGEQERRRLASLEFAEEDDDDREVSEGAARGSEEEPKFWTLIGTLFSFSFLYFCVGNIDVFCFCFRFSWFSTRCGFIRAVAARAGKAKRTTRRRRRLQHQRPLRGPAKATGGALRHKTPLGSATTRSRGTRAVPSRGAPAASRAKAACSAKRAEEAGTRWARPSDEALEGLGFLS